MNKTLLMAVGGFAALLVAFLALRGGGEVKSGVATMTLPTWVKDDLERVDIAFATKAGDATTAKKVTLAKDGASWLVQDAGGSKFPVEESQLKQLLDAVVELKAGDRIANQASQHKDLEIGDDQAMTVAITGRGKTTTVLFGRAAKDGGSTVRQQGAADVFVAKGRLGSVAKKELAGWRKKSIIERKADEFRTITVTRKDGSVIAVAGTEEAAPPPAEGAPPAAPKMTWKLTAPSTLPAGFRLDDSTLSRLASSLSTLRAADFADGATAEAAGLGAAPHTVIKATLKDGKELTVHVGQEDDKKRVYAQLDGDAQMYLIAAFNAKALEKGLDDLRDLNMGVGDATTITQATFRAGKTKVVVKKGADGAWTLVEPKIPPAEFDVGQIATVVQSAAKLRGARYLGVVDAKLLTSDQDVTFTDAAGKTSVIRFGAAVADPTAKPEDKPKEFYVRGVDGAGYAIAAFQKTRYEKPAELFKKPPPPPNMGGGGMPSGLEGLPPDVRKKLEASMRQAGP
jgi:hypothetical protein